MSQHLPLLFFELLRNIKLILCIQTFIHLSIHTFIHPLIYHLLPEYLRFCQSNGIKEIGK